MVQLVIASQIMMIARRLLRMENLTILIPPAFLLSKKTRHVLILLKKKIPFDIHLQNV